MKIITLTASNGYDKCGEIAINSDRIVNMRSEFGRMNYTSIILDGSEQSVFVIETIEQIKKLVNEP